ncbi:hypothetical protein [Sphingomonas swuensis]
MRGFREVGWVAAVAGTALGCYMVNLKVASERAVLEDVENRIVLAQRDIRVLQTEIGTRGRLEQLESWNVKVLALSAPQAQQFLEGGFQLATLTAPKKTIDPAAPVVLASAPDPDVAVRPAPQGGSGQTARDLMQVASLKRDLPPEASEKTVDKPKDETAKPVKVAAKAVTAAADKPSDKQKAAPTPSRDKKVAAKIAAADQPPPSKKKPDPAKSKDAKAR